MKRARAERRSGNLPEALLWRELRKRPGGLKFRRQHPIGDYILDFVCLEVRLAFEIGGEVHNRGDRPQRDSARDAWLLLQGLEVVRYPAREIMRDVEAVLIDIVIRSLDRRPLHHSASPNGPPPRPGEVLLGDGP